MPLFEISLGLLYPFTRKPFVLSGVSLITLGRHHTDDGPPPPGGAETQRVYLYIYIYIYIISYMVEMWAGPPQNKQNQNGTRCQVTGLPEAGERPREVGNPEKDDQIDQRLKQLYFRLGSVGWLVGSF